MKASRLLWDLYRRTALYWWADMALAALTISLFTVPALLSREFFNTLAHVKGEHLSLAHIIALLVTSELVRISTQFLSAWNRSTLRVRISSPLRERVVSSICQSAGCILPSMGDVITRIRDDVEEIVSFLCGLSSLTGRIIYSVIALAIMIRINAHLTLITLSCIAAVTVIGRIASVHLRRYREASREASARAVDLLTDTMASVQAVQVAGAERHVADRLSRLNDVRRQQIVRESQYGTLVGTWNGYATTLGSVAMLLFAGRLMCVGSFTVGDFALFNYFLAYLNGLPNTIADIIVRFQQARVSIDRLVEIVKENSDTVHLGNEYVIHHVPITEILPPLNCFEIDGLSHIYPNTVCGIADATLSLSRGEVVVITGGVGSGKTTLLKCLLGILAKQSGKIRWNGQPIDPAKCFVPPAVAYAPQIGQLFSHTLRNNVLMGLPDDRLEGRSLAARSALETDLALMPDRWETLIGTRGVRLSGGQKQRVIAARMLARDAELYVIDDLSSALDITTEQHLWDNILADPSKTFLIASTRPDVLMRAHRIIVLDRGHVVFEGTYPNVAEFLNLGPITSL